MSDPAKGIPDLNGKVVVVTGGNAGLGAETVRKLAAADPKCIYVCARTPSKAEALITEIQREHPSANIKPIKLDLSSFESVKSGAAEILRSTDRTDLLFLNAGVSGTAPALTEEGYEWQFGVNHLAHALFAQLLMPLLLKTASKPEGDVRIATVASTAAKLFAPKTGFLADDVKTDMSSYGAMTRYGQSKLANILFAKKLAQLYPSVTSVSVHPGLVKTENYSKGDGVGLFKYVWSAMLTLTGLAAEEGAKAQLWAATAKGVKSGKFYVPVGKVEDSIKLVGDQKLVDEVWDWTNKELLAHGAPGWPADK
ncbi:hypothetical protein LTR85_001148 [Meristemomyces frigidus]|nr:hypothetical protein LTR85_001148 [Meristemomyces frigidus]